MILESMVALIGGLVVKAGTSIATNIENRIINAAIDVVNQKQSPSLTALEWSVSDLWTSQRNLQKKQDEFMAGQRRQIEMYYKDGISFLGYADRATDKDRKEQFISRAIECFTSASNIEVGEAAAKAAIFVGACFYALRRIDPKTDVALENHEYDRAFQIAVNSLGPDRKPPRELIEQLLRLPYLSGKYGTFEVYWKQWEPPKLIDPPKFNQPPQRSVFGRTNWNTGTTFSPLNSRTRFPSSRICWDCHKPFNAQPGTSLFYCPECESTRGKWWIRKP